jgi:hypothetical protein
MAISIKRATKVGGIDAPVGLLVIGLEKDVEAKIAEGGGAAFVGDIQLVGQDSASGKMLLPSSTGSLKPEQFDRLTKAPALMLSDFNVVAGGADTTAAIQALVDAASAAYDPVTGARIRLTFPSAIFGITGLLLRPNVIYDFGYAYFKKLANGTSVATNSMLRTVDTAVALSGSAAYTLSLTAAPSIGDTVGTLTAPWAGPTGAPTILFGNGNARPVYLTNGSTAATWAAPLSGSSTGLNATMTGATYYGNYDNIDIIGGTFDPNGFSCPAQILRLENVRDFRIVGTKVKHNPYTASPTSGYRCWAFQIGGQRVEVIDCKVLGGTMVYQDGFHVTHGDHILVRGGYVESGDDAIACGIDAAGTETWDDEALTNVTIEGVRVKAENGTIKVYYGVNTGTGMPFSGSNRGKVDGVVMRGLVGSLGRLSNGPIYIVDTQTITFTAAPGAAATSAALTSNYTGPTGVYNCIFGNGNIRAVTLTNGATTATWTGGLGSASGSVTANAGDATRIKNITIVDFNLTGGSAASDGVNANGIFGLYATGVKIRGKLKLVDTANGLHMSLGNITQFYDSEFQIDCPALPSYRGLSFYDCVNINIHDGVFRGNGGPGRGTIEVTGCRGVKVHHNSILDIPTSGTGVQVQGVGSGNLANTLTVTENWFTKAIGANTTRAYGQQSGSAGFVANLNFSNNDLRGQANSDSVDQCWNGTGVTPDQMHVFGNRANVNFSPAIALGYSQQTVTFGTSLTFALIFGGDIKLSTAMTSNITINAPTGATLGARINLALTQDATGGRTVTWNAVFKFVAGAWVDAVTTTDANKITSISFVYDGTNWIQQAPNRWV